MPDLLSEMNFAAENVRQVHLDRLAALGVTCRLLAPLWAAGVAPVGVASIETRPDGTFLLGDGPLHVVQPVLSGGDLIDLVAWRALQPGRWFTRTGGAWALGEDALYEDSDWLAEPAAPAIRATPLDWLRASGDGFCILDWDSHEVRGLVSVDAIRCADRKLAQTLLAAISKPVRLPRIISEEARLAA